VSAPDASAGPVIVSTSIRADHIGTRILISATDA
jgi:hypothetical protein